MLSNTKLKLIRTLANLFLKLKIDRIININSPFIYNFADGIIGKSTEDRIYEIENFKVIKGRTTRYSILTGNLCESNLSTLIKNEVKSGMILFDIGANIGLTSLLFSKLVGQNGHVYAFEPEKNLFSIIKKNIKLNNISNISLFPIAISDKTGSSFLSINSEQDGDNRLSIEKIDNNSLEVKTISIDDFCKEHNIFPDFIKMDIQGHEPKALHGMLDIIQRQTNLKILTEFFPSAILSAKSSPKMFLTDLQKFGFIIYQLSSSGQLKEFSMDTLLNLKNDDFVDLYCIKKPNC